jgi:heme/copper-type cytochrome/quinol oxidase subunit 2
MYFGRHMTTYAGAGSVAAQTIMLALAAVIGLRRIYAADARRFDMISWLWLIPAVIIGALIGVFVICLVQINKSEEEPHD